MNLRMKNYTIYILVFVSFLLVCLEDHAQSISVLNTDLQKVRVGLVDEFFDRFNGKIAHPDIPITDNESRRKNLMVLMDMNQFSSKNDSLFQEALEMVDIVISDSMKINFSDTTWVAIAHCKALLEGKVIDVDLYLTVQYRKDNMYKWVISKVDGSILDIKLRNDNEKIMLSPDDHETNFMSLGRMTKEQPYNVKKFLSKGVDYDMTSVFAYLVYNRKLKIDYVKELEFVFTQVPKYVFHVKYFERESKNSGWLISHFYKSTKEDKEAFLSSLHHRLVLDPENEQVSDADAKTKEVDTQESPAEQDIDCKPMFIKRRAEKLRQLLDNIAFIQKKDTLHSRSLYQPKIESLFADSAIVHLQYKKKSRNQTISVSDFCRMIVNRDIKFERIDSVCIPVWDEKINLVPSGINKVELASYILPFEIAKGEVLCEKSKSVQNLFAHKEDTEDGVEWIPIIGDIYVKVK